MTEATDNHPPAGAREPLGGDLGPGDDLPPVEPPTASFIVQLFLLPAAIVVAIVCVWLLFGKIAGGDRTPQEYITALSDTNQERRWIAAHELATLLSGSKAWKQDAGLAKQLAKLLEAELEKEKPDASLQRYLVLCVSAFDLDVGVPAVIRATEPGTPPRDLKVRSAAVWSLGMLGTRLKAVAVSPVVAEALVRAARDDDNGIRRFAAYSLGAIGGDPALAALRGLVFDPDRETRYNAANGLARQGDSSAMAVFREMLASETELKRLGLTTEQTRDVPYQAMRALEELKSKSPNTDLTTLVPLIERWAEHRAEPNRTQARSLLAKLR
jgi:HEAT repeat protein